MKRKIISKLLAVTLMISVATTMSACSSGEKTTTTAEATPSPTTQATPSPTTQATPSPTTQIEQVEETVELIDVKIAVRRTDANPLFDDNEFMKELGERAGLNITWIDWPSTKLVELRNEVFESGNLPDAFYGALVLNNTDIANYGALGYLLDLVPYINEGTMPNFTRLTNDAQEILPGIATPEGNIFGLPKYVEASYQSTNDTLMINTEWLFEVGMEMPTTTDELFDVLMAFKEAGDLNGNGEADEIPLTFQFNDGNSGLFGLLGFTGITFNNQFQRMARVDGDVIFVPATDEYKEFLHYMNKLYINDLIDPEAFVVDSVLFNEKTRTSEPKAGVISAWTVANVNNPIEGNDPNEDGVYQYIAPITGPSGVEPVWPQRITPPSRNFGFAINSEADHEKIERLIQWADMHYEIETSLAISQGEEDVHFKMINDDEYIVLTKEDGSAFSTAEKSEYAPMDGLAGLLNTEGYPINVTESTEQGKEKAGEIYGDYFVAYENYADTAAMQTQNEIDKTEILMADMREYVDEWVIKFIKEGNIDEEWDTYLEGLDGVNIDEYLSIYQAIDERSRGN